MTASQAIDQLRRVIRRQHKALSTEQSYVFWVRRYISTLPSLPKDLSSEKKLERFLTTLALRENVAASTQNQAFNAAERKGSAIRALIKRKKALLSDFLKSVLLAHLFDKLCVATRTCVFIVLNRSPVEP